MRVSVSLLVGLCVADTAIATTNVNLRDLRDYLAHRRLQRRRARLHRRAGPSMLAVTPMNIVRTRFLAAFC